MKSRGYASLAVVNQGFHCFSGIDYTSGKEGTCEG